MTAVDRLGCRQIRWPGKFGRSVLARHIAKDTVPFGASNVPFGVGLKTTLCPLGRSNYLNYLKVLGRLEK